jgi:hypothetical protein
MQLRSTSRLYGAGVVLLLCFGCGVSKQYVGANARTIRTNAEQTSKSLVAAECDATGKCVMRQAVVQMIGEDLKQITERANAMCAIAEPHCEGAEAK